MQERNNLHVAPFSTTRSFARSWFGDLALFMALSRTPHCLLDLTTPVLTALLWLGSVPPVRTLWLGIFTAFAGYTAVYAMNDLIDLRTDRQRFEKKVFSEKPFDLDAAIMRHPVASGMLSPLKAILWTLAWAIAALAGAWVLNPFCIIIFVVACLLEALYCIAWQSSCMKVFVSGAVKTAGPIAAIYAVDPDPSSSFVALVFFWLFSWEIGGQNIPNDFADVNEDKDLNASTLPVRFGPAFSSDVILLSLCSTLYFAIATITHSKIPNNFIYAAMSIFIGMYLLIIPALHLNLVKTDQAASTLFNRASYYPAAMLLVTAAGSLL
ncbi:MAG: UbiA family prenyltransferase [Syntrophorhabdus sp.]